MENIFTWFVFDLKLNTLDSNLLILPFEFGSGLSGLCIPFDNRIYPDFNIKKSAGFALSPADLHPAA
jgi:hypothetical protein